MLPKRGGRRRLPDIFWQEMNEEVHEQKEDEEDEVEEGRGG